MWSSGNVWTPETATNWSITYQVCLYDIGSGETSVLTDDGAGNLNPAIGGDLVAWQTWTPSTIKGYRISAAPLRHLPTTATRPSRPRSTAPGWRGTAARDSTTRCPPPKPPASPTCPPATTTSPRSKASASKGIMTGYGDGNFGPNDWLIHQQFAQMIDLTMGYAVTEEDLFDFTDKPPIVHLETFALSLSLRGGGRPQRRGRGLQRRHVQAALPGEA